ncbi:MAG: hypothetical protein WAS51_14560 [Ilumatobacteraceae bacterium]
MTIAGVDLTDAAPLPDTELEQAVRMYIELRDQRSELKRKYEDEDRALKGSQEKLEIAFLDLMGKVGMTSMPTRYGTVVRRSKTRFSCGDWELFYKHVAATGRFDLLQKRLSEGALNDMLDAGQLPPSVTFASEYQAVITRK